MNPEADTSRVKGQLQPLIITKSTHKNLHNFSQGSTGTGYLQQLDQVSILCDY